MSGTVLRDKLTKRQHLRAGNVAYVPHNWIPVQLRYYESCDLR